VEAVVFFANDFLICVPKHFISLTPPKMNDYILLMHNDGGSTHAADWDTYIAKLASAGSFQGGSSIGGGVTVTKAGIGHFTSDHLTGYMRIKAESLEHAQELVTGNPLFEAGGTVEVRALPED